MSALHILIVISIVWLGSQALADRIENVSALSWFSGAMVKRKGKQRYWNAVGGKERRSRKEMMPAS
jgi:hypothetical protein